MHFEKNELNNNIEPIKLHKQSLTIVKKIFGLMQNKLTELIRNNSFTDMMGYNQNMNLNINNDNNEVHDFDNNNVEIITADPANENQHQMEKAIKFIIYNIKSQEDLNQRLRSARKQYLETLLNAIEQKKGTVVTGKCENRDCNFKVDNNDVVSICIQIKAVFKKRNFKDCILKLSGAISEPVKGKDFIVQSCYGYDIPINNLLSNEDKTNLQEIESEIQQIYKLLAERKKLTDSKVFEQVLKCCEIYKYADCVLRPSNQEQQEVPIELSWLQWLVNLVFSFGHLRDYRYYKEFEIQINNITNFKAEDDICKKEEEELVDGIPASIYYELGFDKGY